MLPFNERFSGPIPDSPLVSMMREGTVQLFDTHRCGQCNQHISITTKTSSAVCSRCNIIKTVIVPKVDYIEKVSNSYDRSPLFRKYLENFSKAIPDPPKATLVQIYEYLSRYHTISAIRPTSVASALKKLGFKQYNSIVIRITKLMLQEPVPILSETLIDRLVTRFDLIVETFNSIRSCALRKKILNFEYLCSKFLLMERRSDLSEMFNLLKTRRILSSADLKLKDCCEVVQLESDLNWDFTSSI